MGPHISKWGVWFVSVCHGEIAFLVSIFERVFFVSYNRDNIMFSWLTSLAYMYVLDIYLESEKISQ